MIFVSILSLLAAAVVPTALAQGDLTAAHNTTSLEGTWSTGSGAVLTGSVRLALYCLLMETTYRLGFAYAFPLLSS